MSIDRLRAHYGFSRMPFGKDLAPGMLHAHAAHARSGRPHVVVHRRAGDRRGLRRVRRGEDRRCPRRGRGPGRVPAHGALSRHPRGRVARDLRADHHHPGRHPTVSSRRPDPPSPGATRGRERGARQARRADHRRSPSARRREPRGDPLPVEHGDGPDRPVLPAAARPADPAHASSATARSPRWISGSRSATRSAAWTPKETTSYVQHHLALAGRSDTLFSDDAIGLIHEHLPRPAASDQQPRRRRVDRRVRHQEGDRRRVRRPRRGRGDLRRMTPVTPRPQPEEPTAHRRRHCSPAPAGWPAPARPRGLSRAARRDRQPDRAADGGRPGRDPHPALVAFGAAVGRGAWFQVEATRHHRNEFMLLVGDSSSCQEGLLMGSRPPTPGHGRSVDRATDPHRPVQRRGTDLGGPRPHQPGPRHPAISGCS